MLNGTFYVLWKTKIKIHLKAIDEDVWRIIEEGIDLHLANDRDANKVGHWDFIACDALFNPMAGARAGRPGHG